MRVAVMLREVGSRRQFLELASHLLEQGLPASEEGLQVLPGAACAAIVSASVQSAASFSSSRATSRSDRSISASISASGSGRAAASPPAWADPLRSATAPRAAPRAPRERGGRPSPVVDPHRPVLDRRRPLRDGVEERAVVRDEENGSRKPSSAASSVSRESRSGGSSARRARGNSLPTRRGRRGPAPPLRAERSRTCFMRVPAREEEAAEKRLRLRAVEACHRLDAVEHAPRSSSSSPCWRSTRPRRRDPA